MSRATRSTCTIKSNLELVTEGKKVLKSFCDQLIRNLNLRIEKDKCQFLITSCFKSWDESKLFELVEMANSSGRFYGTKEDLFCEFLLLKEIFSKLKEKEEQELIT